ncbi:MAG TPA: hypothetical protein VFG59_19865 [Anaeromyxobacter sp.]|nr:hypothetical protein [Anaeromyxobacter sp.]
MTARLLAGLLCALAAVGCGGGGGGGDKPTTCTLNIDGYVYSGTEYLTGCGLTDYASAVSLTFHQAASSCDFTVDAPHGTCTGSLKDDKSMKWLCPPYGSVVYYEATATLSADLSTLSGSFTWGGWSGHCATGEVATTTFNDPPLDLQE